MSRIDESRPFIPVAIAVLTVSDSRSMKEDRSGDVLVQRIRDSGHNLVDRSLVTDDVEIIRETVQNWIDNESIDVVVTTGGTGFTGRDVPPTRWNLV